MNENDVQNWVVDELAGELSEERRRKLARALKKNPHLAERARSVKRLWRDMDLVDRKLEQFASMETPRMSSTVRNELKKQAARVEDAAQSREGAKQVDVGDGEREVGSSKTETKSRRRVSGRGSRQTRTIPWRAVSAAAAVLVVLFVGFMVFQSSEEREQSIVAFVSSADPQSNAVIVHRDGEEREVRKEMKLRMKDTIQVFGGTVSVRYPGEQTEIILKDQTTATFWNQNGSKRIALEKGEVKAEVDTQATGEQLLVSSPIGRAEVVGTKFSFSVSDITRLEVSEGTVRFHAKQSDQTVMVSRGEYAEVGSKRPLEHGRIEEEDTFGSDRGIVGYWPFDDGEGSIATDRSPLQNHGMLKGNPEWTDSGKKGGAISFDGERDYVKIPHVDSYLLKKGTITFWFQLERGTTTDPDSRYARWEAHESFPPLFSKDAAGHRARGKRGHLHMQVKFGEPQVRLQSVQENHFAKSKTRVRLHRWYHLAFTFGLEGMKLYLDGKLVAKTEYRGGLVSVSGKKNREPIALGASTWMTDHQSLSGVQGFLKGKMDEVYVYNRVLSADEILRLIEK